MVAMEKQLVISLKTIFLTLLSIFGLYVVYRLATVIGLLVGATLLVLAMEPMVQRFTKVNFLNKPVSRSFSVILSFAIVLVITVLLLSFGWGPLFSQGQKLFSNLANILQSMGISSNIDFRFGYFQTYSLGVV